MIFCLNHFGVSKESLLYVLYVAQRFTGFREVCGFDSACICTIIKAYQITQNNTEMPDSTSIPYVERGRVDTISTSWGSGTPWCVFFCEVRVETLDIEPGAPSKCI